MISIKVFEVSAGPRAAKVVKVNKDGTIASELNIISAAIGETIELATTTFHSIKEKKIQVKPLPKDLRFTDLGVEQGSFLVVRKKKSTAGEVNVGNKAPKSAALPSKSVVPELMLGRDANTASAEPSPRVAMENHSIPLPRINVRNAAATESSLLLVQPKTDIVRTEEGQIGEDILQQHKNLMLSLTKEVENVKHETASLWERKRFELIQEQSKFEHDRLLEIQETMTRQVDQQRAIERTLGTFQEKMTEWEHLSSAIDAVKQFNEKLANELSATRDDENAFMRNSLASIVSLQRQIMKSVDSPTRKSKRKEKREHSARIVMESYPLPPASPMDRNLSEKLPAKEYAVHEKLIDDLFAMMGDDTNFTAHQLLHHADTIDEVYSAISVKYNLFPSLMYAAVRKYLEQCLPPLTPAALVMCHVHKSREAEYLETLTLKSSGLALHSPLLWIEVQLPDTPDACYFYSSLVELSQIRKPLWANSGTIPTCCLAELSSCCPRLDMRNMQWRKSDNSYAKLLRSKAAASVAIHRPDLRRNMDALIEAYIGKEEELLGLVRNAH